MSAHGQLRFKMLNSKFRFQFSIPNSRASALVLNKDYTFPDYTNADKAVVTQKIQDLIQVGWLFSHFRSN